MIFTQFTFHLSKARLPGIYRDKTMVDKLMYIPNDVTENYPFFRSQLVVKTFGKFNKSNFNKKSPKLLSHE